MNEELTKKSQELEAYNKEIRLIKTNLAGAISKRTESLEKENQKDIEYTFINAHLVRAPITNIIALAEILDEYPGMEDMKKEVAELDEVVKKIGDVLNRP